MNTKIIKILKKYSIINGTKVMFIKAFIGFILILAVFLYGKYRFIGYYEENQKNNAIYTGTVVTDRIAMNIYLTEERLKYFVNFSLNESIDTQDFENNAHSIVEDGYVKYIVMESDEKEKKIYPYNKIIEEYTFADQALNDDTSDMSHVMGPVLLRDGSVFLILEVHKEWAHGNWARVYGLIEYPKILKENGLELLESQNYYYKLSTISNGKEIVNMSSHPNKIQDGVTIPREILDRDWYLTIEPELGWHYDNWNGILNTIILLISILLAVGIFNYLRLRDTSKKLTRLVNIDTLTGAFSRKYFFDYAESAIHRNRKFGLFYIDVDKFKRVNDWYGHDMGDRLLCKIVDMLQKCIRKNDFVSRIGGDEFVVFINDINEKFDYTILLKRFTGLAEHTCVIKNKKIQTNLSIGYAAFPDDGTDVETLLHVADTYMYRMKEYNHKVNQHLMIKRKRIKKCIINKSV